MRPWRCLACWLMLVALFSVLASAQDEEPMYDHPGWRPELYVWSSGEQEAEIEFYAECEPDTRCAEMKTLGISFVLKRGKTCAVIPLVRGFKSGGVIRSSGDVELSVMVLPEGRNGKATMTENLSKQQARSSGARIKRNGASFSIEVQDVAQIRTDLGKRLEILPFYENKGPGAPWLTRECAEIVGSRVGSGG